MSSTTPIHFYGSRMRNAGPNAPTLTEDEIQARADQILNTILTKPIGSLSEKFYRDAIVYEAGYAFRSNDPIKILIKRPWYDWETRYVLTSDPEKISEIVAEFDPSDEEDGYPTQWIFFPPEDQVYEAYARK